jgi:type II secretory pathway pseudopilin PulG
MDEVKAMTHAGETVGRAMGSGLRTLRRGAVQVGQAGAEAAAQAAAAMEHKLAEGGQEAAKELVDTTRKARRQLARNARRTAKDAGKQARKRAGKAGKAGKNLQRRVSDLTPDSTPRRGRRWPWLLVGAMAAAGAVAVLRSRQDPPVEPQLVEDDRNEQDRIAGNGTAPLPRHEQKQPNSQLKS